MHLDLSRPDLDGFRDESLAVADALAQRMAQNPAPDLSTPVGLAQARDLSSYGFGGLAASATGAAPEVRVVSAGGASVEVRILRPAGSARAVYLDIHGGGFFLGSAAMGDARNAAFVAALDIAVVSVEYRLAPEHPWPAGPDDCEVAARWLLAESEREFGTSTLLIGGASAGATLSAVTLLRVRDRLGAGSIDRFAGANLVYGVYDLSGRSPSGRAHAQNSDRYRSLYIGHVSEADRTDPDISPVYANLGGLPPALFTAATLDALYEDSLAMAARWAGAGNRCELEVYPDAPHGFDSFPTQMAAASRAAMVAFLGSCLAGRP